MKCSIIIFNNPHFYVHLYPPSQNTLLACHTARRSLLRIPLIQAEEVTSLSPKQASFENMFVSLYVSTYITEFATISWPSNRGPFAHSKSIWKENTLFIVVREK